jgi:tetratricopeptide (TPR) repeat protein
MSNKAEGDPAAAGDPLAPIQAAIARGDTAAAVGLARRALDAGARHPLLFHLRAVWLEQAGQFAPAATDLDAALALAPGDARLLNALSRCRAAAGQFALAAGAARSALASDPTSIEALYNLGFAQEQLGRLDQAWAAFDQVRRSAPGHAEATARLAALAARRGEHDTARALADEVLARQPRHAIAAFAHIVSDLAQERFAAAQTRARAIAGDSAFDPHIRATALHYVGDALDGQGQPDAAFERYAEANRALRALAAPRFAQVEIGRLLAARLAAEFGALPAAAWTPPAAGAPAPIGGAGGLVFIVGFPRSGTTLLGRILAAHSRVVSLEERPLLDEALSEFIDQPGGLARLAALGPAGIERYRGFFLERLRRNGVEPKGRTIVDQTALNTLHLPVIAKLFPEAKIVFALRDPRDVVLSCFRRLFALTPYLYEFLDLETTAAFYDAAMRAAAAYRAALNLPVFELRNEDLVADFDGRIAALCQFAGLAREDAMRDFAARPGRIATPSAMQVSRGLSAGGVGHWRLYEKHLAPVMPRIAGWVERFGYA